MIYTEGYTENAAANQNFGQASRREISIHVDTCSGQGCYLFIFYTHIIDNWVRETGDEEKRKEVEKWVKIGK